MSDPAPPTPWICIACNAHNADVGPQTYCTNCGRPRPWAPPPPELFAKMHTGIPPAPPPASATPWTCPKCGTANAREHNFCPQCQEARPGSAERKGRR